MERIAIKKETMEDRYNKLGVEVKLLTHLCARLRLKKTELIGIFRSVSRAAPRSRSRGSSKCKIRKFRCDSAGGFPVWLSRDVVLRG
jgi:hypothetical protein